MQRTTLKRHTLIGNVRRPGVVLLLTLVAVALVYSWGSTGHRMINQRATRHLPASMSIFRADSLLFAALASAADQRKNSSDTSFFAESQRHYLDIDWYPNFRQLPRNLDTLIKLYGRSTVRAQGTLPWATVFTLDSITAQLARGDIARAESTMSDLGHYVGDAHQPLHCANNFDGQYTGNNGIHARYETNMINTYQNSIPIIPDSVRYIASPLDFVFEYILQANSYVDSVLAADNYAKSASGWNGSGTAPSSYYSALWQKTQGFTVAQFQRATVDLASLWYTAWVNAQALQNRRDTVVASSIGGGTTVPSGLILVPPGRDTTVAFIPDPGYHVDSIHVNGTRVDSTTQYTFRSVIGNHAIVVWFGINQYSITAGAGMHGSVIPSGTITLPHGSSQSFAIEADPGYTINAVLVDGVDVGSTSSYTFTDVAGNHTLSVNFRELEIVASCGLVAGWNLLSVPVRPGDLRKAVIFPTALTRAFAYHGAYVPKDTLRPGAGYWIKFPADTFTICAGLPIRLDTIRVEAGWNILGSISDPLAVTSIIGDPAGLTVSSFFGYNGSSGGYYTVDSIKPGMAVWVRANQAGKLILSGARTVTASNRIRIDSAPDVPPSPPGDVTLASSPSQHAFTLEQNYPNPFNPTTEIRFEVPVSGFVSLKVYDVLGREVATLVDGMRDAGYGSVHLDASRLPTGVYTYRLVAGGNVEVRRMVVMR